MRQTWHIFKKDVRYLWREIAFLLTLAAALSGLGAALRGDIADAFGVLMALAAAYTIARLIQAEALPGENQFWITRPYRWQSLLAAKLLFMLAFINVPVFLAQGGLLLYMGFPIASIAPGLLWMQVLILICVELPLSVIAALTDSLAFFFGSILVIALLAFGQFWLSMWSRFTTPAAMEWLRDAVAYTALAIFAPPVLYLQYKLRRTGFGRGLAAGLAICGACAYMFISWRTLFPLQSRLSAADVNVQITPQTAAPALPVVQPGNASTPWLNQRGSTGRFEFARDGRKLRFRLPVAVSGVPEGAELQIDSYSVSLEASNGTSQLNFTGLSLYRDGPKLELASNRSGQLGPDLPQSLFNNPRQPLTLHASFYLALFGNSREKTITLRKTPADVFDGIRCSAGYFNELECVSPFRWPARIVSQKSGLGHSDLTRLISYSPFPATLDLQPIVHAGTTHYKETPLPEDREVTLQVEEPLAYLRRDVEVHDLYLDAK